MHYLTQYKSIFFNTKKALSDNDAGYVYHKNLMDRLGKGSAIEWCLTLIQCFFSTNGVTVEAVSISPNIWNFSPRNQITEALFGSKEIKAEWWKM